MKAVLVLMNRHYDNGAPAEKNGINRSVYRRLHFETQPHDNIDWICFSLCLTRDRRELFKKYSDFCVIGKNRALLCCGT